MTTTIKIPGGFADRVSAGLGGFKSVSTETRSSGFPVVAVSLRAVERRITTCLQSNECLRLGVLLGLSLLAHLAVFMALSGSSSSGGGLTGGTGMRPLTVLFDQGTEGVLVGQVAVQASPSSEPASSSVPVQHHLAAKVMDNGQVVIQPFLADSLPAHPDDGEVVFRLWLDGSGKVVRVEPVTAELSQTFIAAARERFLNTAYIPARKQGHAVASVMDVVLRYSSITDPV